MANGHYSLTLVSGADWNEFDSHVRKICDKFSFNVLNKAQSINVKMLEVEKDAVVLVLAFDDWENEICLESSSQGGDLLIKQIAEELGKKETDSKS
jgi:hypothetical protein